MKIFYFLIFIWSLTFADNYYVNIKVETSGDGSKQRPFKTIQQAADILKSGDVCYIEPGVYHESVKPAYSGTRQMPITYKATGKDVVISGADGVEADNWKRVSEHIFMANVEMNLGHENLVFFQNKIMVPARWPNVGDDLLNPALSEMDDGTTPDVIVDTELPDFDYTGAYVWVHAYRYWKNWTTKITGFKKKSLDIENVAPYPGPKQHVTAEGARYFVYSCKDALDADNEWFYDEKNKVLYIYRLDGKNPGNKISIKKRMIAFDLRNRGFIEIQNVTITGATILTDSQSSNIELDGLTVFYPYFSVHANSYYGYQTDKGIVFDGKFCTIRNSEIAYSSGCGVVLFGEYNQVINCYIHDMDFIGSTASAVQLGGKGNVISHCTLTRSGRSVISYGSMYKSLIQYTDMSYSGLLTSDLGLTYGNVIEGGNTEVRYNWLHDNVGEHLNMGLYYDHGTQNIISHHNVVWDVMFSGLQINHYAYYHLIYNNTFSAEKHGFRSTWGNQYSADLYACRFFNNVFNEECITSAGNYQWAYNKADYKELIDNRYLPAGSSCIDAGIKIEGITDGYKGRAPDLGAYEKYGPQWTVGHDFENPPQNVDTTRTQPLYRNRVLNSAFEHEDHLSPWKVNYGTARPFRDRKGQTTPDTAKIRMGGWSLELLEPTQVQQVITGLTPATWYEFAGWLRVDRGESAKLGVKDHGYDHMYGPVVSGLSPKWIRCIFRFKTGPDQSSATLVIERTSGGNGRVFADDLGLIYIGRDGL